MSQKRPDIQGLRCICILMVLLYHYYPRIFPQGRLGVDMFFVISGFLIALMLSKKKEGVTAYFLQFYWRRVKRILPLCYLVFLLSYIIMYILQFESFISINRSFGVRALLFLANVKTDVGDEYEAQLTGAKILLTHYWSLSTEIQFYSFAPLIVLCIFGETLRRQTVFFSFLALVSLSHYVTTTETIAFNSPVARLWQFMGGFIAYYNCSVGKSCMDYSRLPKDSQEVEILIEDGESAPSCEDKSQSFTIDRAHLLSYLSLFIVCSIVFIPSPTFFLDTLFRVSVTLSTMWTLMAVGKNPKFLEHPLSVYMGDISFALYLVHWPILCFLKAFSAEDPCSITLVVPIAFVLSIVLAVVLHEIFEKRYLKWGTMCNIIVILALFIGCSFLVFANFEQSKTLKTTDDFFEKAARLNNILMNLGKHKNQDSKYSKPCTLKGFEKFDKQRDRLNLMTGGTGNLTILIIGNSYARNHQDLIYEGLRSIHNKIYTYQRPNCEALVSTTEDKIFTCQSKPMKNRELVELIKPDLLFIAERGITIKNNFTSEVVLEDKYMKQMINNLEIYQKFTKRIFILGAVPIMIPEPGQVSKAIGYLKKKQRLRDAPSLVLNDNLNQRIRHAKIPEICRKCIVYEWEHVFYDSSGHFGGFNPDTDVVYFDVRMHLGEDGKKKVEPIYRNLAREIEWLWKRNLLFM